jgi:hypothetical protein
MYTLFLWTVVGFAGTGTMTHTKMDWRPMTQFDAGTDANALKRCEDGAVQLGLEKERYRCIKTK